MRYTLPIAIFAAVAAPIVVAMPAMAAVAVTAPAIRPFDQAAFAAAQKAGRPILVWVHAPWCPVCRTQGTTIARVTAAPAYASMAVFRIDYDTQKPLWQKFGATMQSTIIAFHGRQETARIAHDADEAKVSAVIRSAIA